MLKVPRLNNKGIKYLRTLTATLCKLSIL